MPSFFCVCTLFTVKYNKTNKMLSIFNTKASLKIPDMM